MISDAERTQFVADGAICVRGHFTDWVNTLRAGVQANFDNPSQYFATNGTNADSGLFWDDYCNWPRIAEFELFVRTSPIAQLAATAMGSATAQLFHDHVLVKDAGVAKPTPWHQDAPYYFVEGTQTVSFWIALDAVEIDASLRLVAGSHRWPKMVRPVSWLDDSSFYADDGAFMDIPDIDANPDEYPVLSWAMEPGDAVLFDFRTVHGAKGNSAATPRRAFSVRWVGDDARYIDRPGKTSPPYPGHNMTPGQRLREDWFPILHIGPPPGVL